MAEPKLLERDKPDEDETSSLVDFSQFVSLDTDGDFFSQAYYGLDADADANITLLDQPFLGNRVDSIGSPQGDPINLITALESTSDLTESLEPTAYEKPNGQQNPIAKSMKVGWQPVDYANLLLGRLRRNEDDTVHNQIIEQSCFEKQPKCTRKARQTRFPRGIRGPKLPIRCEDGIWVFRSHETDLYATRLLSHRFEDGELKFLVAWKDSWVPGSWKRSGIDGKYWKARTIVSTDTSGRGGIEPVPMYIEWESTWELVYNISQELLWDYVELLATGYGRSGKNESVLSVCCCGTMLNH
ncbi:hypothetical protein TWF718_009688 [Orbilia javanica]|uniref:Uncharacterized protein n=1 Tax=Orbilia javanica TaxID=47235 RepID=A0AAN8MJB0_9PEZI